MSIKRILCTLAGVAIGAMVAGLIARNGGYFPGLSVITVVGGGMLGYKLTPRNYAIIAAIVILAIFYTYYEVEKQITRDPEIPRKLREFFVQSAPYSRFDLQSEDEFPEWKSEANAWYRETIDWITKNMSEAAVSRFTDTYTNTIRVKNSAAVNSEHDKLVNSVNRTRSNLKDLIENDAWDVKDKKERKWRLGNIFRSKKPAN